MVEFEALDIDGVEYLILDRSFIDGEEYLYLSNSEDENDVMFRKVDKADNNFIIPLDNEEEVTTVRVGGFGSTVKK